MAASTSLSFTKALNFFVFYLDRFFLISLQPSAMVSKKSAVISPIWFRYFLPFSELKRKTAPSPKTKPRPPRTAAAVGAFFFFFLLNIFKNLKQLLCDGRLSSYYFRYAFGLCLIYKITFKKTRWICFKNPFHYLLFPILSFG